jgi:hypothetical protein
MHGREQKCTTFSVGKPEGRRALVRSRRRWQNTLKIVFEEIGWESMSLIHLA